MRLTRSFGQRPSTRTSGKGSQWCGRSGDGTKGPRVMGRTTDQRRGIVMRRRFVLLLTAMALALLSASGVAFAVTKIGTDGSDTLKGTVVGPGESIQKAVNAADPGDTIVVRGVHREDVVIRKDGIKLRGDDAVIEAPTRGPSGLCLLEDFRTGGYLRLGRRQYRYR